MSLADLCPNLLIGRRDARDQQIAQRAHCPIDLQSFAPFGPIATRSRRSPGTSSHTLDRGGYGSYHGAVETIPSGAASMPFSPDPLCSC
jgi:hypothetical protein